MSAHAQPATVEERPLATSMGLGMALFLLSEAFLFGSLFIIYYYLRSHAPGLWPPEGVELHFAFSSANTLILLSSSVALHLGIRAIRRDDRRGLASALLLTILLGSVFLAVKLYEWSSNSFGPWDHAYGSIYYTLTGFHALHVFAGLGILGALLTRAWAGRFSARHHLAVELGGLYWHFVDVVWLAVYTTLYLVR